MINIYGDKSNGIEYNQLYTKYMEQLITLHKANWKYEDVNGWSCTQKDITIWYLSFVVVLMFKRDYEQGYLSLNGLVKAYNLKALAGCLNCLKVPFFELLESAGISLNIANVDGVESLGVEQSMWIENKICNNLVSPVKKGCSVELETLAENCCTILLTNECKTPTNACC